MNATSLLRECRVEDVRGPDVDQLARLAASMRITGTMDGRLLASLNAALHVVRWKLEQHRRAAMEAH
jgi:hypothetical protein